MREVERALQDLGSPRPAFHSEADLQHALAWRLQERRPRAELRLERPCEGPAGRIYLDIWFRERRRTTGVELKYKTRFLQAKINEEQFALRNQSAQDIARYDFLADVVRLEYLKKAGVIDRGVAVFITNDPGYWRDSGRRGRVDEDFRIHKGRRVSGTLSWASHAADGTKKGREGALTLAHEYTINWCDYSNVGGSEGQVPSCV